MCLTKEWFYKIALKDITVYKIMQCENIEENAILKSPVYYDNSYKLLTNYTISFFNILYLNGFYSFNDLDSAIIYKENIFAYRKYKIIECTIPKYSLYVSGKQILVSYSIKRLIEWPDKLNARRSQKIIFNKILE